MSVGRQGAFSEEITPGLLKEPWGLGRWNTCRRAFLTGKMIHKHHGRMSNKAGV